MFSLGGTAVNPNVSEIEWHHLMSTKDKDGHEIKVQLGQGVFGQCVKKYYKDIPVAVKVFNHLSSSQDVRNEATTMAQCSYASIPHLFGVSFTQKPYFLVSYFMVLAILLVLCIVPYIVNPCLSQSPLQERSHCNCVKLWSIYNQKGFCIEILRVTTFLLRQ